MCFQFGFVIFWQKDFGAKAAHKMLVKLTPGVKGSIVATLGPGDRELNEKKFFEVKEWKDFICDNF